MAVVIATALVVAGASPALADPESDGGVSDPAAVSDAPDAIPEVAQEVPPLVSEDPEPVTGPAPEGVFDDELIEAMVGATPPDEDGPPEPSKAEIAAAQESHDSDFDPEKSDVVGREEFATIYRNSDETMTALVSDEPLNVELESGEWEEIDTTVARGASGCGVVSAHPLAPEFAATADARSVAADQRWRSERLVHAGGCGAVEARAHG